MPNLIWQIGIGADERACAEGLNQKHGARIMKLTDKDFAFDSLTKRDRLQIVANFNTVTGMVEKSMTPKIMAETLVGFGLKEDRVISLVICNSAENCTALGRTTLVEALRESLIQAAREEKTPLSVGVLCGRMGYVNVYTKVLEDNVDNAYFYMVSVDRAQVGRKYVQTEPSTEIKGNQFIPKGLNKLTIEGFDVP
jgi:hypothetical protein